MTSPSRMLTSGTIPPSGVKLSCMELTAPHEASVVDDREQRGVGHAEPHLLALHVAAGLHDAGRRIPPPGPWPGFPWPPPSTITTRRHRAPTSPPGPPTLAGRRPPSGRRCWSAPPRSRKSPTSRRNSVSGVGFSNGWAELALKNPPPFVPSSLMASWRPPAPGRWSAAAPSSVVAAVYGFRFCGTPCHTSTSASTTRSAAAPTASQRTRSTQKLPMSAPSAGRTRESTRSPARCPWPPKRSCAP